MGLPVQPLSDWDCCAVLCCIQYRLSLEIPADIKVCVQVRFDMEQTMLLDERDPGAGSYLPD